MKASLPSNSVSIQDVGSVLAFGKVKGTSVASSMEQMRIRKVFLK
ncbi:hypothetical protein NT07LI_1236, partial [Listeria innocua FSL S4-378]